MGDFRLLVTGGPSSGVTTTGQALSIALEVAGLLKLIQQFLDE